MAFQKDYSETRLNKVSICEMHGTIRHIFIKKEYLSSWGLILLSFYNSELPLYSTGICPRNRVSFPYANTLVYNVSF